MSRHTHRLYCVGDGLPSRVNFHVEPIVAFWSILLVMLLQPAAPEPRYEQLDNGLRVIVVEDHALPLASVQLWYAVGSACDPPERPGLCNVARFAVVRRSETDAGESFGAPLVSRIERDACWFQLLLPACYLEDALDAAAKLMTPAPVSDDDVAECLQSTLLSRHAAADGDSLITRHVLTALYPNHPYERSPYFVAESPAANEINEFLRRWFTPGNATLLVYGDVSTPRVLDMARRKFARLEWAQPPRRVEQPPPKTERRQVVRVPDERAGVTMAWETPRKGYFENAAIDVLMHRLCNPVDGPLRARLIELGCGPPRWNRSAWRDGGVLVLDIEPTPDKSANLDRVADIVDATLRETAETTYPEIAHNRARALARRDALLNEADFAKRAQRLARAEVVAGDALLARLESRRVAAVSVMDVQAAARALLETRRVVVRRWGGEEVENPDAGDAPAILEQPLHGSIKPPADSEAGAAVSETRRASAALARLTPSPANRPTITFARINDDLTLTVCRVPIGSAVEVRTLVKTSARSNTEPRASARAAQPPGPRASARAVAPEGCDYSGWRGLASPEPVCVCSGNVSARTGRGSPRECGIGKEQPRPAVAAAFTARRNTPNATSDRATLIATSFSHTLPEQRNSENTASVKTEPARSAEQWLDYLTYHGLDLARLNRANAYGLASRGPADFTPQMVELQAELLSPSDRGPERTEPGAAAHEKPFIHILIVGDITAEAARNAVAAAWSNRRAAVQPPATEGVWLTDLPPSPIAKSWPHLSRAGRLTALRDNRVIADVLERGIADPWDMENADREGRAPAEPGSAETSLSRTGAGTSP